MTQARTVVETLKKTLKSNGLTYARVAQHLGMSEASIKRMFANQHFTLERIEEICELMQMDFTDLIRLVDEERHRISHLTLEQEHELVSDEKFLLIALCVQNDWTLDNIIDYYDISRTECIRYLIRLDRLGLIQLLPNNRIRRMVAQDFRWLPRGPIESFFEIHVQSEFLNSHFSRPGELRIYMTGMLSRSSLDTMNGNIQMLAREFASLQKDDAHISPRARFSTGLILAIRPWEYQTFSKLKRKSATGEENENQNRNVRQSTR